MADDKKITVSIGEPRRALQKAAQDLRQGLDQWGARMSLLKRLQFEAAIAQLEISSAFLKTIKCDPPQMTIELRAPTSRIARKAKKRTRGRSR